MTAPRHRLLAHHLILSGYGFWLANDPRGSGSDTLREPKFEDLGPIHPGRKSLQPTRHELRQFYGRATPRLEHAPIWFDERMRSLIAKDFAQVIGERGYIVWACSIGSNHSHLCLRVHKDSYQSMWEQLTERVRASFVSEGFAPAGHRVWAERPYSMYLYTPDDIRRVVRYIEENPAKEGLPPQAWKFVKKYDGWSLCG